MFVYHGPLTIGVPVICSNRASLPEVGGAAAVYFDPYSVEDMVRKMVLVTLDPQLQEELRQKGFENLRRFSRIALEPWPYVMTPWELVELTGKPYDRMNELHQHLITLRGPGLEYLFEYDEEERKFRAIFNREIVDAALKGENK